MWRGEELPYKYAQETVRQEIVSMTLSCSIRSASFASVQKAFVVNKPVSSRGAYLALGGGKPRRGSKAWGSFRLTLGCF